MGEASRRGTFEERKAQAIKAGRIKRPTMPRTELEAKLMNDISKLSKPYSAYTELLNNGMFEYKLNP